MNNTTKTWISEWILYDQNSSFSFYVRSCKLCMFYKWQNISPKTCYFHKKSNRSLFFIKLHFSANIYRIFFSTFISFHSGFLLKHLGSIFYTKVLKRPLKSKNSTADSVFCSPVPRDFVSLSSEADMTCTSVEALPSSFLLKIDCRGGYSQLAQLSITLQFP